MNGFVTFLGKKKVMQEVKEVEHGKCMQGFVTGLKKEESKREVHKVKSYWRNR